MRVSSMHGTEQGAGSSASSTTEGSVDFSYLSSFVTFDYWASYPPLKYFLILFLCSQSDQLFFLETYFHDWNIWFCCHQIGYQHASPPAPLALSSEQDLSSLTGCLHQAIPPLYGQLWRGETGGSQPLSMWSTMWPRMIHYIKQIKDALIASLRHNWHLQDLQELSILTSKKLCITAWVKQSQTESNTFIQIKQ